MPTDIEWTATRNADGTVTKGETWNPVRGCAIVSPGCKNCYAMRQAHRFSGKGKPYEGLTQKGARGGVWTGEAREVPEALRIPLGWKTPRKVFVNSMSDLFHEDVSVEFLDNVFAVMAMCPQHTFQILTKRPERMLEYLRQIQDDERDKHRWEGAAAEITNSPCASGIIADSDWPLRNVWLGVSVEDQKRADERIPHLLETPAAVRWLSIEPLLGPVILPMAKIMVGFPRHIDTEGNAHGAPLMLHWVVVGGESGPGARPMHPAWARDLRDQCRAAGVPYFFKQWGAWAPARDDYAPFIGKIALDNDTPNPSATSPPVHSWGEHVFSVRTGKKAAGRELDGREWNEYPR